jgi:hypothetical protein
MANYECPKIEKGDVVLWYPNGVPIEANARAAICVGVSGATVDLMVNETRRSVYKDCVRHVSDPDMDAQKVNRTFGGWDYSPLMKRLMAVESALSDLVKSRK